MKSSKSVYDDYWKSIPDFCWEEFIVWLEDFTKSNSNFSTEMLKDLDLLSCIDMQFVKYLPYLYAKMGNYAKNNYLQSDKKSNRESYYFWFHGIGYEIGNFIQEDCFYCRRVSKDEYCDYYFIDYDSFISDKKTSSARLIDKKLSVLSGMIEVLSESGIPLDAIKNITYSTISHLEEQENGKKKVLYCKKMNKK